MSARYAAAMLAGTAICLLCSGCPNGNPLGFGPTICDRSLEGNPPDLYVDGTVSGDCYETSAWDGTWLDWPGGRHFKLEHKLGCRPLQIVSYLSFSATGPSADTDIDGGVEGDAGNVSNAAGDQVGYIAIDDKYIVLGNDSCSAYYLRVTACGCEPGTEVPDAGGDGP